MPRPVQPLDVVVRHRGRKLGDRLRVVASPDDGEHLRQVLLDAVKRDGRNANRLGEYSMDVYPAEGPVKLFTYVAPSERA